MLSSLKPVDKNSQSMFKQRTNSNALMPGEMGEKEYTSVSNDFRQAKYLSPRGHMTGAGPGGTTSGASSVSNKNRQSLNVTLTPSPYEGANPNLQANTPGGSTSSLPKIEKVIERI
jgi:K+-transporting ATPase c subunit